MKANNLNTKQKVINVLFFIVFVIFALLQINDPDPVLWVLIYGFVSILFLGANFYSYSKWFIWLVVVCLLVYGSFYFSSVLDWLQTENKNEIFGEMVYEKPYLEGSREFLGVFIAALALLVLLKQSK
ncbi:transmembrane 220 family protein [Tamlana sp. PT2-4]|uniref:Transmembrane 220 family protein n=2 Tax=Neotamlana laminarinivorans TaxID=2883124 RepID=A0A9X1I246_9FLAO|nr:transmembrane 220 family protein [Tamlana laminarinivorans]MCB4798579.1 transmembrane 220 family protein [Tamlana laminarinivorans]